MVDERFKPPVPLPGESAAVIEGKRGGRGVVFKQLRSDGNGKVLLRSFSSDARAR